MEIRGFGVPQTHESESGCSIGGWWCPRCIREAGVLRFILKDLPKRLGHPISADLICGTSVGAINGSAIAAWNGDASRPNGVVRVLDHPMSVSDVYRFEALDLLRSPMRMMRGPTDHRMAWVDATPSFADGHTVSVTQLYEVIDQGKLQALVITATEVVTGAV